MNWLSAWLARLILSICFTSLCANAKSIALNTATQNDAAKADTLNRSSTTVVTGFLDIKRGDWPIYTRTVEHYQRMMRNVLQMKLPMVVFVDKKSEAFVRNERRSFGLENVTRIHLVTLEGLPLYAHKDKMKRLIEYELRGGGWRKEWDVPMKLHPESFSWQYDLVTNTKPYFIGKAVEQNPFNSTWFAWVDAGFGHGNASWFPPNFDWIPKNPIHGKVSAVKVTPDNDPVSRYTLEDLYRKDIEVINGAFLLADIPTFKLYHQRIQNKILTLLYKDNAVDDDQTPLTLLIKDFPSMFDIKHGTNADALRLF